MRFADPIVGTLAEPGHTESNCRPWVMFTALPWCIMMVLAYTTPEKK